MSSPSSSSSSSSIFSDSCQLSQWWAASWLAFGGAGGPPKPRVVANKGQSARHRNHSGLLVGDRPASQELVLMRPGDSESAANLWRHRQRHLPARGGGGGGGIGGKAKRDT